jgi:hypothetical protein
MVSFFQRVSFSDRVLSAEGRFAVSPQQKKPDFQNGKLVPFIRRPVGLQLPASIRIFRDGLKKMTS